MPPASTAAAGNGDQSGPPGSGWRCLEAHHAADAKRMAFGALCLLRRVLGLWRWGRRTAIL